MTGVEVIGPAEELSETQLSQLAGAILAWDDARRRGQIASAVLNQRAMADAEAEPKVLSEQECSAWDCENLIPPGRRDYCSDGCSQRVRNRRRRRIFPSHLTLTPIVQAALYPESVQEIADDAKIDPKAHIYGVETYESVVFCLSWDAGKGCGGQSGRMVA